MRNISPVVKDDDIEKKKHTHSVDDISNFPDIPDKNAVIDWGFYVKATSGIPKTDLAADVQASLGKADTALQSYTEKYTGTYSKPTDGIPKSDLASVVQASLEKADSHESSKRNYRTAVVGQSSSTVSNPYYKFASISMPISFSGEDAAISFKVSLNYNDGSTNMGIITAHIRTDGNSYWQYGELVWEYALSGITLADFILVHNTSVKPTVAELWVKVTKKYASYHFDVISEGTRTTSCNELWTLYNKVSAGSKAELPTDMVSQTSTLGVLKNSTLGDAKTVNNHTVNSDVPANAKFTDTTYEAATQDTNGLMSTADKKKLDSNACDIANKLTSSSYTTLIINTSDWTANSSGGYNCTKTLSSAMAYEHFNFEVVLSSEQASAKLQIESWNYVMADGMVTQTTSNGSTTAFTFYAFTTKPTVALTVAIQGVS